MTIQWYENVYACQECTEVWHDEWSCMCNDRCPECGAETCPVESVDFSRIPDQADYLDAAKALVRRTALKPLPADVPVVLKHGGALVAGALWITETDAANYAMERLERG